MHKHLQDPEFTKKLKELLEEYDDAKGAYPEHEFEGAAVWVWANGLTWYQNDVLETWRPAVRDRDKFDGAFQIEPEA